VKKSGTDYDTLWNQPWAENAYVGVNAPTGTPKVGDLWYDSDDPATSPIALPVSIVNGGTGATAPASARSGLAVPAIGNSTTTAGPPATGTWARGDQWLDSNTVLWLCVTAGSPGTWQAKNVGEELAYTQITATVTITATTAAAAQLVINSGTRNYDGTPIMIEFFSEYIEVPSGQWVVGELWDGSTDLSQHWEVGPGGASGSMGSAGVLARRRLTPTAGSHNYQMRGWLTGAGTGKVDAGLGTSSGTNAPAYMRITRA